MTPTTTIAPGRGEAARILVVDDESALQEALCSTLRHQGFAVTGFTSAQQALAALHRHDFDLLITDLMMPEMDGVSLLRAALAKDADLVGILMTGHGTIDSAIAAMKVGALDYILKPFTLSVMLPVLTRSLAMRRLRLENAELERLVYNRTAELEVVNRELENFSHSVATDLRSPLRSITGFVNKLSEKYGDRFDDECRGNLGRMRESALQMEHTIEDLIALGRISCSEIQRVRVDLSALAEIRMAQLRRSQPERRVEVVIEPGLEVSCDGTLLGLVFDHLLANAWKFTAKRRDTRIEVGRHPDTTVPGFFVRDNGAGFDPTLAHKLFEVSQRLHAQSEFAGNGIGLATVKRIVQRHGGKIWAEGKVDAGATFFFTLPNGEEETRCHLLSIAEPPLADKRSDLGAVRSTT